MAGIPGTQAAIIAGGWKSILAASAGIVGALGITTWLAKPTSQTNEGISSEALIAIAAAVVAVLWLTRK